MAIPWHRRGHLPRQLTHMNHEALLNHLANDLQALPGQNGYPGANVLDTTGPQIDQDLILVYGSNAIIIERGCVPGPEQLDFARIWRRRCKRCRLLRHFVLLGLISSLALPAAYLYKGVWWYILTILGSAYLVCCGIILLLTFCFAHRQPQGGDDERFTAAFHRNAQRIEYTIRMLKTQFQPTEHRTKDEHTRVLHCYLFYRGRKQLLVAQPTPDGPPEMENTWIKLSLPSQSRWWDRVYCAADVSLHALLPWGWVSWLNNSIFLSLQMFLTTLTNPYVATLLAIVIAIYAKFIGPGNGAVAECLGSGDNWAWNWYKLVYQFCVGGRWGIADRLYVVMEGYVGEWFANTTTSIAGSSSSSS